MWANRKISEGVAKKLLKPPTRRKSKLFYYIGYIYLPIGFLVLMPAFAFLDQRVVLGATMLYGAGGIGLMYLDDKLTERKNAENKNV